MKILKAASALLLALVVGTTSVTVLAGGRVSHQPTPGPPASQTAQSPGSQPKHAAARVHVICAHPNGQPIPDAEVYLFQLTGGADGHFQQSGPVASDAEGRANCSEAIFSNDLGNFDRWIYARVTGRLVGVARSAKWTGRRVINPEGKVMMQPSRPVEGQVTVPAGFDPTKILVRVNNLHVYHGPGAFDYNSFPRHDQFPGLDTGLPEIFEVRPDSRGRIRFGDVPVFGEIILVTAGDGLAEAQWKNQDKSFDRAIELTVEEESLVSGRVLSPEQQPAGGLKVTARLSGRGEQRTSFLTSFRAVSDQHGAFAIHGLPEIEFVLSVEDPKNRWVFRPLEHLLFQPDKDPHLTLHMETGVRVSGRVLDPEGKPVQAAGISAVADDKGGPGLDGGMTDAEGRYQFRLPSGKASLYFNSLPDGFAYPHPQVVKRLGIDSAQAEIKNLDFTLQRKSRPG